MYFYSKNRIYRKADVLELLNYSKSTLYKRIQSGHFPPPISLGGTSKGWIEHEVQSILKFLVAGKSEEQITERVNELLLDRKEIT